VDVAPATYRRGASVVRRTPSGEEMLEPYRGGIYGLAIDVGTTTLVFEICLLYTSDAADDYLPVRADIHDHGG